MKTEKTDRIVLIPALLICTMTLIMLVLDVFIDSMYDMQYGTYQLIFRCIDPLCIVIGLAGLVYAFVASKSGRESLFNRKSVYLAAPWILFALCIALSTVINGLTSEAVHGIPYRNIGIFNMFAFILVYLPVSAAVRKEDHRHLVLKIYMGISVAMAAAALYDRYIGMIPAFRSKKELSAVFFNGNHYGYFLVMAILIGAGYFLFTNGSSMIEGAVCAAINTAVLMINHSLGCIIAVAIVLLVTGVVILIRGGSRDRRRKVLVLFGLALIFTSVGMIFSEELRMEIAGFGSDMIAVLSGTAGGSTGHNRLMVWRMTADYIAERPFFGYGCEGMSMDMYAETGISNPHNEILTYAAYYGIPAAVFYVTGVLMILLRGCANTSGIVNDSEDDIHVSCKIARMAAAGYFISSISGVAMFYITPFLFILMGLSVESLDDCMEQKG